MNVTTQQELAELAARTFAYVNHDAAIASCEGNWSGGKFICTKTHFVAANEDRGVVAKFALIDGVMYRLSKFSVDVINGYEYYYGMDGSLYTAHLSSVIDNGFRIGRFEAPANLAHAALRFARDAAAQM